ncbi:hypothetical protein HMPREF3291_05355 [Bacillus sp. HMSC76G11]|nr:hypothetical protein HMPREF3291_05355 [Bacillus sp. HMSC76G11]
MAWYHWIAVYMIIIGGIIFTVIPEKPLWLWGLIALLIIVGIGMGIVLPHKEDKYAKRAE